MNYYPELDSHIREKVKAVLDLSNYASKKELGHATGVDTSDVADKKDVIALKTEVDKLNINKLVNVPTSLNNLKTKVEELDIGKLKKCSHRLKKISDATDNEFAKNTNFTTLETKVNNLEQDISDATALICNLEKKIEKRC